MATATSGLWSPGGSTGDGQIDEALEESFPASDPPSWTLGVERPASR